MKATTRHTGRLASTPVPPARAAAPSTPTTGAAGLLSDERRRALVDELKAEFWRQVRAQVAQRSWPGRLAAWDVSPEDRVLAGVQTRQALVWMDAGPAPDVSPEDPRLQLLRADRLARERLWQQARRRPPPRGR